MAKWQQLHFLYFILIHLYWKKIHSKWINKSDRFSKKTKLSVFGFFFVAVVSEVKNCRVRASGPGDVADAPTVLQSPSCHPAVSVHHCPPWSVIPAARISSLHPNEHGHMSAEPLRNDLSLRVNIQPRLRRPGDRRPPPDRRWRSTAWPSLDLWVWKVTARLPVSLMQPHKWNDLPHNELLVGAARWKMPESRLRHEVMKQWGEKQ